MLYSNVAEKMEPTLMAPLTAELKALILDDSSFDRLRIKREIKNSGLAVEVDEINCLYQLKPSLLTKAYDLVIFDYFLPDGTGENALSILLSDEKSKGATPILVSGNPWLNGGSVTALGKTIPLIDKTALGTGDFIRQVALTRQTDLS